MSLIKCSECGKEISDKAKQCINCGAPIEKETKAIIKEDASEKISREKTNEEKENKKVPVKDKILIFVFLLLIIGIPILSYTLFGSEKTLTCTKISSGDGITFEEKVKMKYKKNKLDYVTYTYLIGNPSDLVKRNWEATVVDAAKKTYGEVDEVGYKFYMINDKVNYEYKIIEEIDFSIIEDTTIKKYELDDVKKLFNIEENYSESKISHEKNGYSCS